MRVFAISDLHIDYKANFNWLASLSQNDYRRDILILAGDVSDDEAKLTHCFHRLSEAFFKVMFVPGNHELWVHRHNYSNTTQISSFDKFNRVCALAKSYGVLTEPYHDDYLSIYPLFSWYDFSFGKPGRDLESQWMDFMACHWGENKTMLEVSNFFLQRNPSARKQPGKTVITFSHFLPRIDLIPSSTPSSLHFIYPVLGCTRLDQQIRKLGADIHVYGHSHVNRNIHLEGISYHNNAFGYPSENHMTAQKLLCIHQV
ncbi:MAG: putative phosphodiesterase [Cellvibrionaceae bacterium]|jgi:predicted phosphodiesterase